MMASDTSERSAPSASGSPTDRLTTVARLITELLSPAVLVAVLVMAVAWHAATSPGQGIALGLIAAAAGSFVPISFIIRGVRRGRWTDRHVTVREHRKLPLLVCLTSTLVGAVVLWAIGAPRELVALVISMVASLVAAWPITMLAKFKISVHALVAAGTVGAFVVVFGPLALVCAPAAVAVGWSRVRLRDHTAPEVIAGAALGLLATGGLFPALLA